MRTRSFIWFILPTGMAMILFIALPIISIVTQSIFAPHEATFIEVETCTPLIGCKTEVQIDHSATEAIRAEKPLGRFVGLEVFLDRGHLATAEIAEAWGASESLGEFRDAVLNLPFYRALYFTLVYTFTVTPIMLILGLMIALGVNSLHRHLKSLMIFFSLLPMIVTQLVGALILFWMIDSRGVIGNALVHMVGDPDFSLKASTGLMWVSLIVYGTWNSAPFSFIVFYAGLQTLPKDQIEAAQIDGATRWHQLIYVIIPHLMPLVVFVTLIQLMDNFRVLEPIIGFNAEAHATSLSWIIYNDLSGETQQLSSAAATSVLTVLGVAVLLAPVLVRTWRDFKRGA